MMTAVALVDGRIVSDRPLMQKTIAFGVVAQRLFAAALFAVGAWAAVSGWRYGLGRLNDIGPGAFPLGLGILLMVLSAAVALEARAAGRHSRFVVPIVLVPLGICVWALVIDFGGLLAANAAVIGMMAMAEERLHLRAAVLLTVFLTIGGYVVFVLGFNLPFGIIGKW